MVHRTTGPQVIFQKHGILPVILYVFSGISVLTALIGIFYGFSFQHGVQASTMFVQGALGPFVSQIITMLISGFKMVIWAFSGILLIAAILLYCAGRNLMRSKKVEMKLFEVDSRLVNLELQTGEAANEALV